MPVIVAKFHICSPYIPYVSSLHNVVKITSRLKSTHKKQILDAG